jgi:hypothetical protein
MLGVFPVVAVIGPRQVGKSTLVRLPDVQEGRRYLTLDDIGVRSVAEQDPDALVADGDGVILDEVQLVPELLRSIKKQVDSKRVAGKYIVTGSADLNYCSDLSHVLAGRVGVLRLPPITKYEEYGCTYDPLWITGLHDPSCLKPGETVAHSFAWQRILRGGFPLSITANDAGSRRYWFESFRMTYLERDVRRISDIGGLTDFARLMELTATRTGQVLNQAAAARDAGLNAATGGRYLSILEASFIIQRLVPYFENIGKRLVKSPKLYWTDTGLAAYLLGIEQTDEFPAHRLSGALFETFAMQEIQSLLDIFIPEARVYYLRTHDGLELDGIIKRGQMLIPFEVKSSRSVKTDDADNIKKWKTLSGHKDIGFVFYAGNKVMPLGEDIWAVPI